MDLSDAFVGVLMESVSAIGKYPGVSCDKGALTSQVVPVWSNHVGEVPRMSWFRMALLTSVVIPGVIPLICFFFADFSPGAFAASRPLNRVDDISEHALRRLVPFARWPRQDTAQHRRRDTATAA